MTLCIDQRQSGREIITLCQQVTIILLKFQLIDYEVRITVRLQSIVYFVTKQLKFERNVVNQLYHINTC